MRARTFTVLASLTASLLLASGLEVYKPVERRHWAFQKRSEPVVPKFTSAIDSAWAKQPIDAFVLSRLQKEELRPAPQASKATLIRRLYFDLTGLPDSTGSMSCDSRKAMDSSTTLTGAMRGDTAIT